MKLHFLYKYDLLHILERLEYATFLLFKFYFWGSQRGKFEILDLMKWCHLEVYLSSHGLFSPTVVVFDEFLAQEDMLFLSTI